MTDDPTSRAMEIAALSDDDLLLQINEFDPYDVEFTRRYRSLVAERDKLQREKAEAVAATVEGLCVFIKKVATPETFDNDDEKIVCEALLALEKELRKRAPAEARAKLEKDT